MVGFDIGCHEAIITVINIRDLNYIHIEFVIKKLWWFHDSQCQKQPPDSLM